MSQTPHVLMQIADPITTGVLIVIGIVVLVVALIALKFARLWLQAYFSRADVRLSELIGMWLRRVDSRTIVLSKITAVQAGLQLTTKDLESHYLAGGRVPNVVRALIAADRANIDLSFKTATAIDLAGRDILDAIQTSVNPKVIDCPDPKKGKETIDAVAQDGIQLRAKARVTVRTNIQRLVGGATEETIIARVGEGIVTTIGSAITYKNVLENPDRISKAVLDKGLDAGTAFEILSIDIADVDVGENVGAQLQAAQAEADMRRAKAEAEKRRAMAVAREQEMRALVVENDAKV
ncbi:MAG: flotillin-like protein FloA, partial [Solirubrobacterales bacterium]